MWVVFTQQKNGLRRLLWRWMKSQAASTISSSIVSIRLRVSGPVSLIVCFPLLVMRECTTPRGPNRSRKFGYCAGSG